MVGRPARPGRARWPARCCWGATWDICRDAELPAADYVDLVLRGVAVETDATAVRTVLGQAASAAGSYAPPARRAELRRDAGSDGLRRAAGRGRPPGSDLQLALARAFAGAANAGWAADRLHGLAGRRRRAGRAR